MVKWSGVRLKTHNPKKTEQWTELRQSPRTEKENIVRKEKKKEKIHYTTLLYLIHYHFFLFYYYFVITSQKSRANKGLLICVRIPPNDASALPLSPPTQSNSSPLQFAIAQLVFE